jgi:hypothetical protein
MRPLTRPLRVVAIGVALFAGSAWPVAGPSTAGCASGAPHAGLVIDTGSRTLELCVTLDATSVSGLHLIELAHDQLGLSYALGQGGQAVCRLDGVGPQGDDCFADYPDFWGYWHGDGHGGWTWSPVGGASYEVGDGALDGWVWGSGDTGATHPEPPVLASADVCAAASPSPNLTSAPSVRPTPDHDPGTTTSTKTPAHATGSAVGTSLPRSSPATATRTQSDRTRAPWVSRVSTTPAATAAGVVRAAGPPGPGEPPPDGGGPPAGLFVAIGLAVALGIAGWLRLRSHPKGAT